MDAITRNHRRSGPRSAAGHLAAAALILGALACGDDDGPSGPTGISYGETALVVLINPAINDINSADVATPDTVRFGVRVLVTPQDHWSIPTPAGSRFSRRCPREKGRSPSAAATSRVT